MELRYLRDTDKREVDFVIIKDRKPIFAVECKLNDRSPSSHLFYFKEWTKIPRFYQVSLEGEEKSVATDILITSFKHFCRHEGLK